MTDDASETWVATAQSELFYGWQRWVSFACIWAWSCVATLVAFRSGISQELPGVLSLSSEIIIIAASCTLALTLLLSRYIKSIVKNKKYMICAGTILSVGSLLVCISLLIDSTLLYIIGMALGGIALAPLKIAWGEMYSLMSFRRGLISMGYSVIASMLFVLLIGNFSSLLLPWFFLLCSLPCAYLAYKGAARIEPSMRKEEKVTGSISFSGTLLLLPAMVAISYGLVRTLITVPDVDSANAIVTATQSAELLVGVFLLVASFNLIKGFGPAQVYSIAIIAVVAGLLLFSSDSMSLGVSFFVYDFGYNLFYFFLIVYWGDLSWRTGMPIVRVYTIGYFTFQAMHVLGTFIGFYSSDFGLEMPIISVSFSIVFGLFAAALLLFGNTGSSFRKWLIADSPSIEQGDEIPYACAEIAKDQGLSPREQEILGLLARGRNASYIARALHISPDTARTHIKNIYRKLDVHARQDVIDLIEKVTVP